uniref:Transposase Tc1-like domain-containing protein n=1 Tax=Cyprinus carpio carpio TaxID=630221 RepID=A0A9J8CJ21_CYPCA
AVPRVLYQGTSVGSLWEGKKCGKKRCTTRRGDRTLRKIVEKDRFQTLGDLRKQWTESGVETSRATVHRRVLLNQKQRQKRLTWATEKQHWTRFLPHFFLPTDFPLRCLDTALWEQPIRSEISFCVLPSRLRVSMMAFWTAVRSAVLPMIAVLSNEPGWEFLKASGIFCRCLELIS